MARHHVVIVGSGFGGLFAAKRLKNAPVDITLIAPTPNHLFQPLLYQVATGILSDGSIAPATRELLRNQKNVEILTGRVTSVDLKARTVRHRFHDWEEVVPYDSLIVAAGAGQSYFGNDHFATFAPGMKTIDDALELKARIFWAFEAAEREQDPQLRNSLLTFVVVGAGPTGVEMAGQIRDCQPHAARSVQVDRSGVGRRVDRRSAAVLPSFGEKLGKATLRSLTKLGVEVVLAAS